MITLCLIDPTTFEKSRSGEGDLGLLKDSEFLCAYRLKKLPENHQIMQNMMNDAYEAGKRDRSEEILKLLGGK